MKSLQQIALSNRRVLIREDFNVPLHNGEITNDARIRAAIATITYALQQGAKILLVSHLGRPEEGHFDPEFSLQPVADRLSQLLNHPVRLVRDWIDGVEFFDNEILLGENVRFLPGENKNDPALSKKMAALCDVFVMDAFAVAHRKQASTYGVALYAKEVCAGPLVMQEITALNAIFKSPQLPLLAIIGGAKVSTKLGLIESLLDKVQFLILGGGIANTFLAAKNIVVGDSLVETDLIATAKKILDKAQQRGIEIPLPTDVVVAQEFSEHANAQIKSINEISAQDKILDIGPETRARYAQIVAQAKTIVWNGPVGVFEFEAFSEGTRSLAQAIARSQAFSIAGGGDTVSAIEMFLPPDSISYVSTGGGAFLEYFEFGNLPGIAVLDSGDQRDAATSH